MRKINILAPFLLVLILLLTSCKIPENSQAKAESSESVDPPSGAVNLKVNIPKTNDLMDESNWTAMRGLDTQYVKLQDISPEAVPEIKIGLIHEIFNYKVKETRDGFLCGYIPNPEIYNVSNQTSNTPRMRKFSKVGKVVWEKEYDYKTYTGRINNILAFDDGSFIFSVQTYPAYGKLIEKSFIIKCDKDGRELWKRDFEDYSGGLFLNLFATGRGEIIAVGQWRVKDGKQVMDNVADDIVVTKLDKNGNILKQKSFGGSDFDMLNTAVYDKEVGIIINGRTQSNDGDFKIINGERSLGFVACIDESLNFRWVMHERDKESFVYDQVAVSKGYVYVPGSYRGSSVSQVPGFLMKLDKEGKRVWTKEQVYAGFFGVAISVLENGHIAMGSGQQNQGMIVILDERGSEMKKLEDLKFAPRDITPTSDGGFIVTSIREIKAAPQPLYVSSIWYDTELVAVKYKSDFAIEWRKTYDRVKDKRGQDFALPLESGKMVVE